MPEYIEEEKTVEIPHATGVKGFVKMIEDILQLSRVQQISITANPGRVTYKRFRLKDAPEQEVGIDFTSLMPSAIVRATEVVEVLAKSANAAVVVSQLFFSVANDGLNPVAFLGGRHSEFPKWHERTASVSLRTDEAYGLPFYKDPSIPDESLLLCAAYSRRGAMVDVVRSYKVTIPRGVA